MTTSIIVTALEMTCTPASVEVVSSILTKIGFVFFLP